MSIVLNGTTGITTPDVTSDSYTGPLAVDASAPDDSLVVDASGNVGIGTSSPNFPLSFGANIGKTIALFENAGTSVYGIGMGGAGSAGDPYRTKLFSNGSERIAITDAGSVGIGTSSPSVKLQVNGASNASALRLNETTSNRNTYLGFIDTSGNFGIDVNDGGYLRFAVTGAERARIDSSGNLLVGTTSNPNVGKIGIAYTSSSQTGIVIRPSADTGTNAIQFLNAAGAQVGYISTTGSATSYTTSSDYRLKENWVAVADASTRVNALKPVNFAWKVDGKRVDGFLAHELAEVVPEAVSGEKDATEMVDVYDEEGNVTGQEERPVYQGIDQSKLVPLLTAALQEALAKIDELTARVSALEAV
jgi:hypothetical protein